MHTNKHETKADKIRALNDDLRKHGKGGYWYMSRGISSHPLLDVILSRVRDFDAFTNANDPYGEHDFGAFEFGKDTIFFKIDYYGCDIDRGSENAADPDITTRVLTIMLAEEY